MAGREVHADFPAGGPYGSWPADGLARELQAEGIAATVVMDMDSDRFLVVEGGEPS